MRLLPSFSQYSDIYSVSRNIYADDYFKGELGLKFNKDEIFVPLGERPTNFTPLNRKLCPSF